MRSRFLSGAAALVVAAACDSFGADTSSGVPPDAGDASPAGERDGGVDAAQGSSFCARAGAHAFCEDFDEGDLVAGGWAPGDRRNVDGGTLAITPAIFESAPNALALDMTSVAAAGFANANDWLQRAFVAPTASKAVFSVGLRIDRIEPTSGDGGPYLSGRAVEIAIGSYYLEVDFAPRTGGYALTVYETSTDGSVPFVGHELGLMGSNGPALITEKAWHGVGAVGGDAPPRRKDRRVVDAPRLRVRRCDRGSRAKVSGSH